MSAAANHSTSTAADRTTAESGESGDRSTAPRVGRGRPSLGRRGVLKTLGVGVGSAVLGVPATSAAAATLPRLGVAGNRIVTPDGEPVTLRGVSVADPKRLDETSDDRGLDAASAIDRLTDSRGGWHPTVVRVPVHPRDVAGLDDRSEPEPGAFDRKQLRAYCREYLDPVVDQCAARGVYAIVDYHRHEPGHDWADLERWRIDQPLQEEALMFWETVAPRYASRDHVIYEVYNEPTAPLMNGPTTDPAARDVWHLFLEFVQPMVDAIRAHTDTLTLVGSPGWSQHPEGALVEPVRGANLAYTYHIYPGHDASRELAWDGTTAGGDGVERVYERYPLVVTEFGWRDYDHRWLGGTTSAFGEPFLRWLESHDAIHWVAWCGDVWWDPRLFEKDPATGEWLLLGRDAGTPEDAGEYIRQALAVGGVPENYWDDAPGESDDGTSDDDTTDGGTTDDGTSDEKKGGKKRGWEIGKGNKKNA